MPRRLPILFVASTIAVALAACHSDGTAPTVLITDPIVNPTGPLNVGDLIKLNVNTSEPCTNPVYHAARVVAVGTKSIVLEDTLNPRNGFALADYQSFAARFDTLIYPMDVEAFGEPTDIDRNGRIAIVFTRAVNELTPGGSASYIGGFAYSRDAFPHAENGRAGACAGSNQGEYFYSLAPDPTGAINGNVRTKGFVDSVTAPILAHELQHIINFTRRLYVNNAPAFEEKWLDEGLAHIAEELLFYREAPTAPRTNLDINALRANGSIKNAYNLDQSGNSTRYRQYLTSSAASSPYALTDTLSTRGAAWNFLRYSADRLNANDGFGAGTGQVVTGTGDVSMPPVAGGADYTVVVVNTSLVGGSVTNYILKTTGVSADVLPARADSPVTQVAAGDDTGEPARDFAFESRLRTSERSLVPLIASARSWYAAEGLAAYVAPRTASLNAFALTDADNGIWRKLVNSTTTGMVNFQGVFGSDAAGLVRDWSVSHAIDDVAALQTQYQQRSWNYHSIYPNLGTGGASYPLAISAIGNNATVNSTVTAGGAAFFKVQVSSVQGASLNLSAPAGAVNPNLIMIVIRTR